MPRPKKKTEANYSISVKLGEETFTGNGATILEALETLPVPIKIISKAFITIKNGERKYETMLFPARSKRIFHKIARITLAKQFELLLK